MFRDLLAFLDAFRQRWLTLMSGGASVPFAIGAVLFNDWQRALCALAAALFFAYGAFLVWRREHDRANVLEARLKPQIEVNFEPDADGLAHTRIQQTIGIPPASNRPAIFIRAFVRTLSETRVEDCRATISNVALFDDEESKWHVITSQQLPCPWSSIGVTSLTILPGTKNYFDIAWVAMGIGMHPASPATPSSIIDRFSPGRRYRFSIMVDAASVAAKSAVVEIFWKNDLELNAKLLT